MVSLDSEERRSKASTCGDGVDAELHVFAGAIKVVVEGEVQTSRRRRYYRTSDLRLDSGNSLERIHQHVGTQSRFGVVIIRAGAFSVCWPVPLFKAKHIRILNMARPTTQVTNSVKITARHTGGACSFSDDNVVQRCVTGSTEASLSLEHNSDGLTAGFGHSDRALQPGWTLDACLLPDHFLTAGPRGQNPQLILTV